MARWYAKFDSGSGGWVTDLDTTSTNNGFFDRAFVSTDSASGAEFRDGLIASRSALSADVYDDLDSVNKDGSRGIIFPSDTATFPTPTFLSWSNAYSSSFDGIKIPTSNTYGPPAGTVNYSTRPTSSVLSTNAIIGAVSPADPIQLNYNLYLSASLAVESTLSVIKYVSTSYFGSGGPTGSVVSVNPNNARPGNNRSRTLHSLWNDPTMSYFAWDDFTPGRPQWATPSFEQLSPNTTSGPTSPYCIGSGQQFCSPPGGPVGIPIRVKISGSQFLNDSNPEGFIDFQWGFRAFNNDGYTYGYILLTCEVTASSMNIRENGTWPNVYKDILVVLAADGANFIGDITLTASYRDPKITTSRGPFAYQNIGINMVNPCPYTGGSPPTSNPGTQGPPTNPPF